MKQERNIERRLPQKERWEDLNRLAFTYVFNNESKEGRIPRPYLFASSAATVSVVYQDEATLVAATPPMVNDDRTV